MPRGNGIGRVEKEEGIRRVCVLVLGTPFVILATARVSRRMLELYTEYSYLNNLFTEMNGDVEDGVKFSYRYDVLVLCTKIFHVYDYH